MATKAPIVPKLGGGRKKLDDSMSNLSDGRGLSVPKLSGKGLRPPKNLRKEDQEKLDIQANKYLDLRKVKKATLEKEKKIIELDGELQKEILEGQYLEQRLFKLKMCTLFLLFLTA